MLHLGVGLSVFSFSTTSLALMPLWSFTPNTYFPPRTSVTATGVATVKYTVTNNSSKGHNLALLPQTGVYQNNGTCALAPNGNCTLVLSIVGRMLPANGFYGGPVLCQTNSDQVTPNRSQCYQPNSENILSIRIVPDYLSMLAIPIQEATANQSFVYNLKSAVKFYDENAKAGFPAQGVVSPVAQDGLRFDPSSFSIVGTPTRTGTYLFKVGARNANSTAEPVDFIVQVHANVKDKPVFKSHHTMVSAILNQKYRMNLMALIEPQAGFRFTNQISFRIAPEHPHPDWLHISKDDATLLEGDISTAMAGNEVEITLIASSNTGGDSLPLTVKIPVAYDPDKKSVIRFFQLNKMAGSNINEDLSAYIDDPAHDANLELILEKVEPAVNWLHISSLNPTVLEGIVPETATGQQFQLALRANTAVGGPSDLIVIPLKISADPKLAPRFKAANPLIPVLYPGQPFFYDFVANKDIYPEYEDVAYEIKFADDFTAPDWLRIEDNKLISEEISNDVNEDIYIKVVIKNIPGGLSEEYLLRLVIMN